MSNFVTLEECNEILKEYGLEPAAKLETIDSSHGEEDVRLNYILDRKYVIRANNAEVFDEKRFEELNRLILRYKEFGLQAPLFLKNKNGNYLGKQKDLTFYVSEYIDGLVPPEEISEEQEAKLVDQRLKLIAEFAETYKNVDLSDNMSMYSLFDLSPYDLLEGIDEKQANLNNLLEALDKLGEKDLSEQVRQYDANLRSELLKIYKSLPRCVFQGDENWGNLVVDDDYNILGLFDFNMAGTDVIVNYFANNALLIPSIIAEDKFAELTLEQVLAQLKKDFDHNTNLLREHYHFSEAETRAYDLYAKIALVFIYPHECSFEYWLENDETREKTLNLLREITKA